jgi:lipoprotein-anchoring transpeptidase ErfK/SrfK
VWVRLVVSAFVAVVAAGTAAPAAERPAVPIALGVSVADVELGGLTSEPARMRLRAAFERPLRFLYGDERWTARPQRLGARAFVDEAVTRALRARPRTEVALPVNVQRAHLRRYVSALARRFYRPAEDAHLVELTTDLRPSIEAARPGVRVDRRATERLILRALRAHVRSALGLPVVQVKPRVTEATFGPVIVIRRESRELHLYAGETPVRSFPVAVGRPKYPTPLGTFSIVVKDRNPWWRPPPSDWAKDLKPVPPGPGNPLGTRWMGLSGYSVGIHATPDAASVGYSASHGCIRMYVADAEWLFEHVELGTPVVIVAA